MSWWLNAIPVEFLVAEVGVEWPDTFAEIRRVPVAPAADERPAPPTVADFLRACRESDSHGVPWFTVDDREVASWLPPCPGTECGRHTNADGSARGRIGGHPGANDQTEGQAGGPTSSHDLAEGQARSQTNADHQAKAQVDSRTGVNDPAEGQAGGQTVDGQADSGTTDRAWGQIGWGGVCEGGDLGEVTLHGVGLAVDDLLRADTPVQMAGFRKPQPAAVLRWACAFGTPLVVFDDDFGVGVVISPGDTPEVVGGDWPW